MTRPDIVIRGTDRNRTVLDGGFRRLNGVEVTANGVAVENLTAGGPRQPRSRTSTRVARAPT